MKGAFVFPTVPALGIFAEALDQAFFKQRPDRWFHCRRLIPGEEPAGFELPEGGDLYVVLRLLASGGILRVPVALPSGATPADDDRRLAELYDLAATGETEGEA